MFDPFLEFDVLDSPVYGDPEAPKVGATEVGRFLIGGLHEVRDGGGEIIADAKLTRFEIEYVARYWFEQYQTVQDDYAYYGASGSREWRIWDYAPYRLSSLEPFLSEEFKTELRLEAEKRQAER